MTSASIPVRRRATTARRPYLYLAPLVVVLLASSAMPTIYAIVVSFFGWNWGSDFPFVGLANYAKVLGDPLFWWSFARTLLFAVVAVVVELLLGLVLALAVSGMTRGVGWLRTLFIVPLMVSGIVVSLAWKIMLDPTLGVIPFLLGFLGIKSADLLGDPHSALLTISGIDTWWQTGFVFIILSAAMAALPEEPFEAAAVDGAGPWQRLRYLTLPLLLPVLGVVAGIRLVDCLKVFALVFGTTDGGPARSTEVTQTLAYKTGFTNFAISESMTMMIVYAVLVVLAVSVVLGIRRRSARA